MFRWHSALLALLVAWPAPVRAEDVEGASDARELLGEGVELRKRGDDARALAAFEQAFALEASPEALAQRALAEQALGRWLDAHEHLAAALSHDADTWVAAHRATLDAAFREIGSRLGSLEVICNVPNAEVRLDGRALGRTPLPGPVRAVAGQSVLQLSADGYFAITRQVQVDALGLARVEVTLTPAPPRDAARTPAAVLGGVERRPSAPVSARQADPPAESATATRDALLYTSLGLSALGIAVGVTGYVMREVNVELYNDDSRCDVRVGIRRSEECPDEASAWRRGEALAIGGFSGAAVFGAVAAYLWLTRPSEQAQALACAFDVTRVRCGGRF